MSSNYIVDMGGVIAEAKEKKILNHPFRTQGQPPYAVYTKSAQGSIIMVAFDACQADENSNSTVSPSYWGSKVNTAKASTSKPQTLDDLCNFFTEKVQEKYEPWNGEAFYSKEDLLKALPELKNVAPTYTLSVPKNQGASTPSDTLYNSQVAADLKKQQSA